jgi:hypothetical protein
MKMAFAFDRSLLAAAVAVVVSLTGCAAHERASQLGNAVVPVYDTAEKIQSIPACKAVVAERGPCYVRLRTSEGKGFLIGSPAAGADVLQFLEGLRDGQTYRFPDAFQKYQEQRRRAGQ